jgi:hypothetical protein
MTEHIIALLGFAGREARFVGSWCSVHPRGKNSTNTDIVSGERAKRIVRLGTPCQFVAYLFGAVVLSILTLIFFTLVSFDWSSDEGALAR